MFAWLYEWLMKIVSVVLSFFGMSLSSSAPSVEQEGGSAPIVEESQYQESVEQKLE
jgi:hypothetical protein